MTKSAGSKTWHSPLVAAALDRAPAVFPDLHPGVVRWDTPLETLPAHLSFGVERNLRSSTWFVSFDDELFDVMGAESDLGGCLIGALLMAQPSVRDFDQPDREFFEWVTDDRRSIETMLADFLDAVVTAFRAAAYRLSVASPHLPEDLGRVANATALAAVGRPEWTAHHARWDDHD